MPGLVAWHVACADHLGIAEVASCSIHVYPAVTAAAACRRAGRLDDGVSPLLYIYFYFHEGTLARVCGGLTTMCVCERACLDM